MKIKKIISVLSIALIMLFSIIHTKTIATEEKILQNFPYLCQTRDLSLETMGIIDPEMAAKGKTLKYGDYACGPTSLGMIFGYYKLMPDNNKNLGKYVACSKGFPSNKVSYYEPRKIAKKFITICKQDTYVWLDVFGIWGRTQYNCTEKEAGVSTDCIQYYDMNLIKAKALVKENNLEFVNYKPDSNNNGIQETNELKQFVKDSIDSNTPILWRITGHYLVCIGYKIENGKFLYVINDPYNWSSKGERVVKAVSFNDIPPKDRNHVNLYSIGKKALPSAPEQLTLTVNKASACVNKVVPCLNWLKPRNPGYTANSLVFNIYHKTSMFGKWTCIATDVKTTSYQHCTASKGKINYYKVTAKNYSGENVNGIEKNILYY